MFYNGPNSVGCDIFMQCKPGSKAVRRRATEQYMERARCIWQTAASHQCRRTFPSLLPELWIPRTGRSLLMPTPTILMAYRDRKSTLSCSPLSPVLSPVPKLCHPTSHPGPTTLRPISAHPTSHLSRTTLRPISCYPTLHHLSHTHTTLRFHRHRIQQQRTRVLCCPRICRSLTPSPR